MKKFWKPPFLLTEKAKKLILTMKLTVFILFLTLMQVSATVYSQATKFSFRAENKQVVEVLRQIEENSDFRFFFLREQVDVERKVTVTAREATVEQILDELFRGQPVSYEFANEALIVLTRSDNPLGSVNSYLQGNMQQPAVSGTVTEESGEPLPGVTVIVKGTTHGTVTNGNGEYSLSNIPEDATLQFSFVGMRTQEVEVGNQTTIDVTMEVDAIGIDEVIAVGYGTSTRQKLVSSVSTLKTDKIERVPYKTVTESLAGRVSGVFVQANNGDGALPTISIRGGGEPLYVINGIKQSKEFFSMIPAGDIENISVLKDASASAVYGAEAGDGIILVTTKQGTKEGININYNGNVSFQTRLIKPNFLSPYEFALMANEAAYMDARPPTYSDEMLSIFQSNNDPRYKATDVYEEVVNKFRPLNNHNLSLSGKSGNTNVFLSLNYQNEGSEFKVSDNQGTDRYSVRSNISHKIQDLGLTINGHIDAQKYDATFPPNGSGNIWTNIRTYGISPGPLRNPEGNLYQPSWIESPLAEASDKAGYWRRQRNWLNTRLSLTWELPWVKGLDITTFGNYQYNNTDNKTWRTTASGRAQLFTWENEPIPAGKPSLNQSKEEESKLDFETQINYNRVIADWHTISLTAVYTEYELKYNMISAYRRDFLSSAIDQIFAGSTENWQNNGIASEEARRGWIGRAKYDYDSKYILEFSFRYDGSDNFPKDKRWGFFPAVSVGWNLGNESFIQEVTEKLQINSLKLRGSWGKTGLTGGGGRFGYIPVYNYVNNNYFTGGTWIPGFSEGPLVSSEFTWYERTSYNLGVDFAFFNNKLSGSADGFFYRTTNYLASPQDQYTTPLGKSLPQILTNSAHRRAGAEFLLDYKTQLNGIQVNIGSNIAYFNQLWEKRYDESESVLGNPYRRLTHEKDYYTVGYLSDGYFQSIDEVLDNPRLMGREINWPGNVKYVDINGDGKVDFDDQRRIGTSNFPHLTYGGNIDLLYKGFSFNALFQGSSNRQIYLGATWYGAIHNKAFDIQSDSWTVDNPDAKFPRNSYVVAEYGTTSDFYLINAWYIRLKALSFSYDLKHSLLKNLDNFSEFSVLLSGTNLLTFSPTLDYYMDPEVEASASHQMRQPFKVFNIGIRLGLK